MGTVLVAKCWNIDLSCAFETPKLIPGLRPQTQTKISDTCHKQCCNVKHDIKHVHLWQFSKFDIFKTGHGQKNQLVGKLLASNSKYYICIYTYIFPNPASLSWTIRPKQSINSQSITFCAKHKTTHNDFDEQTLGSCQLALKVVWMAYYNCIWSFLFGKLEFQREEGGRQRQK